MRQLIVASLLWIGSACCQGSVLLSANNHGGISGADLCTLDQVTATPTISGPLSGLHHVQSLTTQYDSLGTPTVWAVDYNGSNHLYRVDPATGTATFVSDTNLNHLACDPLTGRFVGDSQEHLYDYDPLTGQTTLIFPDAIGDFNCLAFDQQGVLWGQLGASPSMARIDLAAHTYQIPFGGGPYAILGMAVRPEDGQMFAITNGGTHSLWEVDTATMIFTEVGPWQGSGPSVSLTGLAFVPSPSTLSLSLIGALAWSRRRR